MNHGVRQGKQIKNEKMKRIFNKGLISACVISLFAIVYSCKKNSEALISEKKIATVINLSQSISFIKYVDFLDDIENHLKNTSQLSSNERNQLKSYLNTNSITESQLTAVAKYSGYNSLNEFIDVFKKQDLLISDLKSEFKDIKSVSVDSLFEAISSVHNKNIKKVKVTQLSPEELCRRIYNNCNSKATVTYSAAAVGCTVTAIGVGAATAVVGGVIYQIGCGGLSYWYLLLQRDECALNYEICVRSK